MKLKQLTLIFGLLALSTLGVCLAILRPTRHLSTPLASAFDGPQAHAEEQPRERILSARPIPAGVQSERARDPQDPELGDKPAVYPGSIEQRKQEWAKYVQEAHLAPKQLEQLKAIAVWRHDEDNNFAYSVARHETVAALSAEEMVKLNRDLELETFRRTREVLLPSQWAQLKSSFGALLWQFAEAGLLGL